MKTNPDDPNLTAYALGELSLEESAEMEKALANSAETRAAVEQTRDLAGLLRDEFRAELREAKPRNIMPLPTERSFWSDARWSSLAVAAGVAIFAIIGLVLLFENRTLNSRLADLMRRRSVASPADIQMEVESDEGDVSAIFEKFPRDAAGENAFVSAQANPISRVLINFATASYPAVREFLEAGSLPPKDAVRVEEMINYFRYDSPVVNENGRFAIDLEAAACPWQPGHQLLRIALKENFERPTSIDGINAAVEFNPSRIASYRLIGYDSSVATRNESKRGTRNSAELAANQAATILYEVVPARANSSPIAESELVTVNLRYRNPTGEIREEMTHALKGDGDGVAFAAASRDFRFAAAVAEFAMLLRKSSYCGSATFADVLGWAEVARGDDADGARAEFIRLARRAQSLTNG